jgi:hypothetical protein
MSKHLTLILLVVALVGLVALIRIYWGGDQGVMCVWKTQPSFVDTVVYIPEVTALPKEDLVKDHPGVWEQLVVMDLVNEEHEAKMAQIRQKRMHRFTKTGKVAEAKKTETKVTETKTETKPTAKETH